MDFDADGQCDVLSGSRSGAVHLFRSRPDGSFAGGVRILDRTGKRLRAGSYSTAFAADWDADEDLDLLIGSHGGKVYLACNQGTRTEPAFNPPKELLAAEEPIRASDGLSHPVAADWDGDGKLDLLLGTGAGSVVWYRNVGTPREPKLVEAKTLVPPPKEKLAEGRPVRGKQAKTCVADFNADGRLDLLLGDLGTEFTKVLTQEEEAQRDAAAERQAQTLAAWAEVLRRYRTLLQSPEPEQEDRRQQRQAELETLRKQLQQLNEVRMKFFREEQALIPGTQHCGHVWLFLRK